MMEIMKVYPLGSGNVIKCSKCGNSSHEDLWVDSRYTKIGEKLKGICPICNNYIFIESCGIFNIYFERETDRFILVDEKDTKVKKIMKRSISMKVLRDSICG